MRRPNTLTVPALPPRYETTREALRALACYVIAPERKARTGHISLRPTGDGFGTPPEDHATQIFVAGTRLHRGAANSVEITTLAAAASFVGVDLSPDPAVGHDLPTYTPDERLEVDEISSLVLGAWYAFGDRLLSAWGEAQIWPEHFDLAVTVALDNETQVNLGASPGDTFNTEPYVYVGPHNTTGLAGDFWNAPFGAVLTYADLRSAADPHAMAAAFIGHALNLIARTAR